MFIVAVIHLMYQAAGSSVDITTFTMVTTHFQLCYVFLSYPFYYPAAVTSWGSMFGIAAGFVFEILSEHASPTCLSESSNGNRVYVISWAVSTLAPLALMLPFWAAYHVVSKRQEATWNTDRAKRPEVRLLSLTEYRARNHFQDVKKRSIKTILMILLLALMYGIGASVKVWYCVEFPDGVWRLPGDPSMECSWGNADYVALLVLSILVFCIYFVGSSCLFFTIAESSQARKSAADNYVTHARCVVLCNV